MAEQDSGNNQACVGRIDGQHMIFGGEERWWYATHVRSGDRLVQDRIFTGYKVAKIENSEWGFPIVQIKVDMVNQDGKIVVTSLNEVELPR